MPPLPGPRSRLRRAAQPGRGLPLSAPRHGLAYQPGPTSGRVGRPQGLGQMGWREHGKWGRVGSNTGAASCGSGIGADAALCDTGRRRPAILGQVADRDDGAAALFEVHDGAAAGGPRPSRNLSGPAERTPQTLMFQLECLRRNSRLEDLRRNSRPTRARPTNTKASRMPNTATFISP